MEPIAFLHSMTWSVSIHYTRYSLSEVLLKFNFVMMNKVSFLAHYYLVVCGQILVGSLSNFRSGSDPGFSQRKYAVFRQARQVLGVHLHCLEKQIKYENIAEPWRKSVPLQGTALIWSMWMDLIDGWDWTGSRR